MDGLKPYTPAATKVSSNGMRYHVFLSFRGKDVRKTLVDHLFQALSAAGLNVFLDSDKLKKGESIDLSLENAIKSSAICIPIFSKGFASSAWCLREAALMLASPGLIIPLFYEMEPTHVRYPQGDSSPYKESFEKHDSHIPDRYSRGEIDGWKNALEQICSRSGWSLDMTAGFEGRLVKKVVNDIINTLDRVPLQVAKHPVGLETVQKDLIQLLERVARVGILGIGGIGKTTVAKAVYNEVRGNFGAATFVFNVRDSSLTKLQGQILKDLANYKEEVPSVEKGKSLLTDRLQGIRALVVLDDVDNRVQLDALAGDWLSPGSRLIITSRDKHILNSAHISKANIFQMGGLKECKGLQLFCLNAFRRPSPALGYEELSKRIVEACKGHPLSLEIIGAFLYDKQDDTDIDCWYETLENITVNRDIFKTLYISYSGLSAEEKEIFLDTACYFIGERTTSPIVFWKSMYKNVSIAVNNLSKKLLIKIDEKGVFDMHDLVRDMGRLIAGEDHTRQRETVHFQSSSSFNNASSTMINISRLRLRQGDSRCLKMLRTHTLRYLHLEQVYMIENILDSLPLTLRWLKVDSCSFASMWYSSPVLGRRSELKIMDWTNCRSLRGLPDSVSHLSQLQSLNLSGCHKLECLPNNISDLSQLQYMNLSYCENLICLPDSIGNLSRLEYLNLTCCKILIELPDSIGDLSQLKHLSLSWCEKLHRLPESVSNLSKLEKLDVLSCYSAWKWIPCAILMKPTLCLLGLPPRVENWRKTRMESSLFIRQAMADFREILAAECRKIKSKLRKTRLSRRKSSLRIRSEVKFKLSGKPNKEKLDSYSYHETKPIDTRRALVSSAKEIDFSMKAMRTAISSAGYPDISAKSEPVFPFSPSCSAEGSIKIETRSAPVFSTETISAPVFPKEESSFYTETRSAPVIKIETRSAPVFSTDEFNFSTETISAPVFPKEESSFYTETRSAPVISTETRSAPVFSKENSSFFTETISAPVFPKEESSFNTETRSAPVISTETRSAMEFYSFFMGRDVPVFSTETRSPPVISTETRSTPVFSKENSSFFTETISAPASSKEESSFNTETRNAPVISTETRNATEFYNFFMGTSAPVFSTEESSLPLDSKRSSKWSLRRFYELIKLERLSKTRSAPVISTETRSAMEFDSFFMGRSAPTEESSLPLDSKSLYELWLEY